MMAPLPSKLYALGQVTFLCLFVTKTGRRQYLLEEDALIMHVKLRTECVAHTKPPLNVNYY